MELGGGAFWSVVLLGACSGAISFLAFRRWSDAGALRSAGNAALAHLLEFRLFADEPALIMRAQRDLLFANGRWLRLLLAPMLLLSLPFALVIAVADAFFSRAPLRTGEPAVVTAHYVRQLPDLRLIPPDGFQVETAPVRVTSENEVSWRVRPLRSARGNLQLRWDSRVLEKSVVAGSGPGWISEQRSGSVLGYLAHPAEYPFRDGTVDWVRIQYPLATVFGHNWLTWFSIAACCGALASVMRGLQS
ncbi:MAG: hypothetical protein JWO80_1169 [Bryobacterales bacterium]|nr:hypothetical protein [Bryobacterales bacterium]